jgi:hypothetical protein
MKGKDKISTKFSRNISNEDWTRFQVRAIWSSPRRSRRLDQNARTWNLVQSELEDLKWYLIQIHHYLKWGEYILIQSKDWIHFDPVLGLDQYTSPGIQYDHVSKIKQYGWLIHSWIYIKMSLRYWILISNWSSITTGGNQTSDVW